MLSAVLAAVLRERGHDVVALIEVTPVERIPDDEVLTIATELGRAVVTDNVSDFRKIAFARVIAGGDGHAGLVLMPGGTSRTLNDTGRLADMLETVLDRYPNELALANGEAWI